MKSVVLPTSVAVLFCALVAPTLTGQIPVNFKVAFIGDTTTGSNAAAVLRLIDREGAGAVVHAGDLDYVSNPTLFENHVNGILGADFPYFYSVGNHEAPAWPGSNGYRARQEARFNRLGIPWTGLLGENSTFTYQGLFFVTASPDELGITRANAAAHVKASLATDSSLWSIAFWHKNQAAMQVGGQTNQAGWGVYEESRRGGAIIATSHEHSYSRTHLMSHMQNLTVANSSNALVLAKDEQATGDVDEGRTFAFVSGLGGHSVRSQLRTGDHWASIYTLTQGATYGALFGEFNYNGEADLARFYFKNIRNQVIDIFFVRSTLSGSYSVFGNGCPGSNGTPSLSNLGIPILGQTFSVQIDNLPNTGEPVIGLLGLSNTAFSPYDLPLDLTFTGMAGCSLYTSIHKTKALTKVGTSAIWSTMVPNEPALVDAVFYQQVFVHDRGINFLGACMSNAGTGTIGN